MSALWWRVNQALALAIVLVGGLLSWGAVMVVLAYVLGVGR